jgi:FMN phosphatase YigB (HAD superfamily)
MAGAHHDGTVQAAILPALEKFVVRDPELAPTLHKLRSAGKKLFLLTNSQWPYTDAMMRYLLEGFMPEYPQWRNFFDVVVCTACKPAFFQERRPLMERDGQQVRPASFPLERGRIYEGGNLHDLERGLGITGDQVLYVGDHIYGDILRSKKESAWRTCMVMQELEGEIVGHDACREDYATLDTLEEQRDHLEEDLRYYQSRFKELAKREASAAVDADRTRFKRGIERIRGRLRQLEGEAVTIERRIADRFHPYCSEASNFGAQVELYGCLYTSRVTNLFAYSAQQHFRSARDVMPHEIG